MRKKCPQKQIIITIIINTLCTDTCGQRRRRRQQQEKKIAVFFWFAHLFFRLRQKKCYALLFNIYVYAFLSLPNRRMRECKESNMCKWLARRSYEKKGDIDYGSHGKTERRVCATLSCCCCFFGSRTTKSELNSMNSVLSVGPIRTNSVCHTQMSCTYNAASERSHNRNDNILNERTGEKTLPNCFCFRFTRLTSPVELLRFDLVIHKTHTKKRQQELYLKSRVLFMVFRFISISVFLAALSLMLCVGLRANTITPILYVIRLNFFRNCFYYNWCFCCCCYYVELFDEK